MISLARRGLRILCLVLLIILAMGIPGPMAQEYGEDSPSLGQLVDDFENIDYVSVNDAVIRNSTLNCMELNYTSVSPNYENFKTYIEVDAGTDITVTDRRITWNSMIRNIDSYVYRDYGVGVFGDFEYYFTFVLNDVEAGDITENGMGAVCSLANSFGSFADAIGGDYLGVTLRQSTSNDDKFRFRILQYTGGINDFSALGGVLNIGTYYCTFNRTGTAIFLKIYSDSARTNLLETLTDGGNGDNTAYRYLHGIQSWDSVADPNDYSTGYIEYLWNKTLIGGFESDGYFITEDYLNYSFGSSLVLMTKSTVPSGTTLKAQFSKDNSTWVDNKNVTGSTTIDDGFLSLDLRDLSFTDIYVRFNFTGTASSTPRLYQSRLISTEGPPAVAPVDVTPYLGIGIILALAMILLADKARR